jgi:arylsulfatase A-like enzyme
MTERKNVLLIVLDQWRAECLSASGHPNVKTPHIDQIASDGVLFRQHYAQALPCGPSRASLYTGMYAHNHRSVCNGTPLDAAFTNIAREVRKKGYEPALFGYTDTSMDPREFHPNDPLMHSYERVLPGFDCQLLLDEDALPWQAYLKAKGYQFKQGEALKSQTSDETGRGPTFAPALFSAEDSSAAFITDEVLKYLSVREDQSWFVHISFISPHHPYIASADFHDRIHPDLVAPPVRRETLEQEAKSHPYLQHYLPDPCGKGASLGMSARDNLALSEQQIRQVRATYYSMISEVDVQIGRLIRQLKSTGDYDNTLIIITSDHGDMLGDHWQFGKHCYFDQALHIPLLMRDPNPAADQSRGQQLSSFTETIDLMPSILHWLDSPVPDQCDGFSLLGHFREDIKQTHLRDAVHAEFDFRDIADTDHVGQGLAGLAPDECAMTILRDEHFKYVHFTAWPALLFDLENDPDEFNNLAQQPEYQTVALKYASKLLSWCMKTQDQTMPNIKLTGKGIEAYSEKQG